MVFGLFVNITFKLSWIPKTRAEKTMVFYVPSKYFKNQIKNIY